MTQPELTRKEVLAAASRVLHSCLVGVLTTVDRECRPHSRWMAGIPAGDDLARILAVAARGSRKLDHLVANTHVCWLFSDGHDDEVVTLNGTMQVLESQTMVEPVWQELETANRKYSMNLLSEPENLWFVGLETQVRSIEYMCPRDGLTHPVVIDLDRS